MPKLDLTAAENIKEMVAVAPAFQRLPELPVFRNPMVESLKENSASEFHSRLTRWINAFDATLDNNFEVGVRLVSFGQTVVFHLEGLGYWDPSLISFNGKTDDGEPVELIQHVSQISILLMKLPRKDPSTPKRPIGFHAENKSTDDARKTDATTTGSEPPAC